MVIFYFLLAKGIRVIVVNRVFENVDEKVWGVMQDLGSDALYLQLCKSQRCFRARLSPKPWRIGIGNPPKSFPFDADAGRDAYDDWNQKYVTASKSYKVCDYVETLGDGSVHPDNQNLIQLHDQLCCSERDLPLA